jgi:nucleotide-binding universal stress UspA family protein
MTATENGGPVVVGVDASDAALPAVRFAADEARRRSAPLAVVHALAPFDGIAAIRSELGLPGTDRHETLGEGLVAAVAASVAADLPADRITTDVAVGNPVDVLCAAAAGARLLVVGRRGAGGVAGLLLGSTADGVVREAACPVVVLPDELGTLVRGRQSVVVGVEGRSGDDDVLEFAFAEADARGTDLLAVHAWEDAVLETAFRSTGPLADWTGMQAEEQRLLAESLAGWRDKYPDVVVREAVVRDRTAHALVAAGMTAQLLVVGRPVRPRLASVTRAVVHRATCPVAVVPTRAAGR